MVSNLKKYIIAKILLINTTKLRYYHAYVEKISCQIGKILVKVGKHLNY
jgi:hypothetical protein